MKAAPSNDHFGAALAKAMLRTPGLDGCDSVTAPGPRPPNDAYTGDPATEARHYYDGPRYAEHVWAKTFAKWAPRLQFSVLNVTGLSESRGDLHLPGNCVDFCVPGLPHAHAEMLLRLLEQLNE